MHVNPEATAPKQPQEPRDYDRDLYKLRHLVEKASLDLKQRNMGVGLRWGIHPPNPLKKVAVG